MKYIGGFREQGDFRPVSAAVVRRIVAENRQYGTVEETRAACRKILARGDWLSDSHGYSVRLAKLP